jgi:hypothetical protein
MARRKFDEGFANHLEFSLVVEPQSILTLTLPNRMMSARLRMRCSPSYCLKWTRNTADERLVVLVSVPLLRAFSHW